jgi:hypothetical protein
MKVDGSLGSLVQGVSQQAPTERRVGQHGEQVNMLADPVRGLSRRHGSRWQTEVNLGLNNTYASAHLADAASYRSFDYTSQGRDFVVLYRSAARPSNAGMPPVLVYDKTNGAFLTLSRNVVDTLLDSLESGGISAITAVGKYVFFAGNAITPSGTNTNRWSDSTNQAETVLWVRGGAYARTYKATVTKTDNSQVSFEYTTPTSSYPGTLDTSGVPFYMADTSGSTPGTAATTAAATDLATLPATAGGTLTLTHTPVGPVTVVALIGGGADQYPLTLIEGVDFTRSGTTITWLAFSGTGDEPARGVDYWSSNGMTSLYATYSYAIGGTSATTVYATQTDVESLYVRLDGGYGVAPLAWADWNPTSLTVQLGGLPMTNVYPAQPAAGEYSWAAGAKEVIFDRGMVNVTTLTATYTHTKTIANPNYTKSVADLTNRYNSAVTQWIGDAAEAIQPENIAESLKTAATTAGLTGVTRHNATVVFTSVKDITFSDSGDGSLLKGVANTLTSVAELSDEHFVGKLVKISPTGQEAFYMKATAKNPSITSGVTEVRWVEGASIDRTINSALCYGVADGTHFYMAGSATLLNTILTGDHPTYAAATVGDDDTSPMPYFVGRTISYLGVFQDRLLVGAGAVIRASKVGDYLNFFRSSVLTVPADDPFEMLSQGSEDDTIRFSCLYDRDLILFGKRQYAVSGRSPLTPTNANMPVMSSHDGADDAPPVAAGGLIFYAKQGQAATSVHQIEPGRNAESPESFPASSQLDKYMTGEPVELAAIPKPSTILVRTTDARSTLFVFTYLDSSERRLQDCWNRWDYPAAMGPIIGTSKVREGVLVFTLRHGNDVGGTPRFWAVCDLQSLDGQLDTMPYMDSLRPYADIVATPGSHHTANTGLSAAFDDSSDSFLLGADDLADVAQLVEDLPDATGLTAGFQFESYWGPTNPAIRNQESGKAQKTGRLVVTKLLVSFEDSSGFRSVVTFQRADTEYRFNGRILGDPNNIISQVPVTDGVHNVVIGRASREYTQRIYALTWLPLNLTSVDWEGQSFHRPLRVS